VSRVRARFVPRAGDGKLAAAQPGTRYATRAPTSRVWNATLSRFPAFARVVRRSRVRFRDATLSVYLSLPLSLSLFEAAREP